MWLRVATNATDQEAEPGPHQLFDSNIQSTHGPQGHIQFPQGNFETMREDKGPSQINFENKPSIISPTAI